MDYGGFFTRLGAHAIDLFVAVFTLWVILYMWQNELGVPTSALWNGFLHYPYWQAGVLGGGILLYALMLTSPWQAGPGKMIMRVYVGDRRGDRIGFIRALLRCLIMLAPFWGYLALRMHYAFFPEHLVYSEVFDNYIAMPLEQQRAYAQQHPDQVYQFEFYTLWFLWSHQLMLILSLVWYLPILFNREHAAVHDWICRTRVFYGEVND